MVKLVACDIDGTLLKLGQNEISPEVFKQMERLQKKGVVFCLASGRQYNSLRTLAAGFADKTYYICNNGAIIYGPYSGGDKAKDVLSVTPLQRERAELMCEYILFREGLDLAVGGVSADYIFPQTTDLFEHLHGIGYDVRKITSINEIFEDILKVTARCPDGAESYVEEFKALFGELGKVAVSGKRWLDITATDKGTGISALCKILGISLSEVMAIGDNFNDLPMLDIVGYPVIMRSAVPEIKARYAKSCAKVEDALSEL